jgi:hypothetical protein
VIVRVALSAPPYANALLSMTAVAFAVVLSLAYNRFLEGLPLAIPATTTPQGGD